MSRNTINPQHVALDFGLLRSELPCFKCQTNVFLMFLPYFFKINSYSWNVWTPCWMSKWMTVHVTYYLLESTQCKRAALNFGVVVVAETHIVHFLWAWGFAQCKLQTLTKNSNSVTPLPVKTTWLKWLWTVCIPPRLFENPNSVPPFSCCRICLDVAASTYHLYWWQQLINGQLMACKTASRLSNQCPTNECSSATIVFDELCEVAYWALGWKQVRPKLYKLKQMHFQFINLQALCHCFSPCVCLWHYQKKQTQKLMN